MSTLASEAVPKSIKVATSSSVIITSGSRSACKLHRTPQEAVARGHCNARDTLRTVALDVTVANSTIIQERDGRHELQQERKRFLLLPSTTWTQPKA